MGKILKALGGTIMFLAFFVIIGTAGSDCDGDCMEKAIPISQMLIQFAGALLAGYTGYLMYNYGDKYE